MTGASTYLLTTKQMIEAEERAITAGTTGLALMDHAGAAVAEVCLGLAPAGRRTAAVLCGPGNNGGDGFVVARLLQEAGWSVRCFALGDLSALPGDAARSARRWAGATLTPQSFDPEAAVIIVDALFGAGLARDLSGDAEMLVKRVNASGTPVIAVDIPSGIDGNTGEERGCAVEATVTVTFGRAKPGHYLYPGAAKRGRLIVADIGIAAEMLDVADPPTILSSQSDWLQHFPWPTADGHKYKRGHAVVVSGSLAHTGAARLSARAALRIGAGLVTLASPTDALSVNAAHLTAIMLRAAEGASGLGDLLGDSRKNTVVLGPGLGVGSSTRALVETALAPQKDVGEARGRACVIDADALTSFAGSAAALASLVAKAPGPVVITPHDGEFARLFSADAAVTGAEGKVARTRAAAALLGCVVLLKGPDTVVAAPNGCAAISDNAVPWLATAGSGDVLSGLIGGLLAQGMPAFEAANAAVCLHAEAGRHFGPGLIAEDIPETIPAVLRQLAAAGPKGA